MVPQIANLQAMQAKGAGELHYRWSVSGLAVIKEVAPGKLILKRSQNSGTLTVKADDRATAARRHLMTTIDGQGDRPKDAWVQRTPDKDEKPVDNQFYARDDKNEGTLYYNGTLTEHGRLGVSEALCRRQADQDRKPETRGGQELMRSQSSSRRA